MNLQERLREEWLHRSMSAPSNADVPKDLKAQAADALDQKDDYIARLENQRKFDNDMLKEKDAEIARGDEALKQVAADSAAMLRTMKARIEKLEAGAQKLIAELEAADDHHSAGCMNWTACEVSAYQCGVCDLREAIAAAQEGVTAKITGTPAGKLEPPAELEGE